MTKGRRNPNGEERRLKVEELRDRDGDLCCRCRQPLDFSVSNSQRPDFVTIEHFPIPWRECRSHKLRFLKLSHRFCNEHAEMLEKACARVLRRFVFNWHKRHPEAMMRLVPEDEAIEAAWAAHEATRLTA